MSTYPQKSESQPIGVLLVNLGTPDAPTTSAVKRYLKEFLSDPRVIEIPAFAWQIILRGIVLPIRAKQSAKKYATVWTSEGSPLLVITQQQALSLQQELDQNTSQTYVVKVAMRYGKPTIKQAIDEFMANGIEHIKILPLYPQYCGATTASVFDAVARILMKRRYIPSVQFIAPYHQHALFIHACCEKIKADFYEHGEPEALILSYHGMPKITYQKGDPYYEQCLHTSKLIATTLNKPHIQINTVFQSRFGAQEWLKPYAYTYLSELPQKEINNIAIFCPGFSADCLETLEEMAEENKAVFLSAGGQHYRYIPALNNEKMHITLFKTLIEQ